MTLLTYRYARVCLSLPYGYVKTYLGGLCLRSLLIVPGTEATPDSIPTPIPISFLKSNPNVMNLLRNCCFYYWMNIRKYSWFFNKTVSFLKEKPREQSALSWHPPVQFQTFKKKKPKSGNMCYVLKSYLKSEIKGNYVLNSPDDPDQCLLPH